MDKSTDNQLAREISEAFAKGNMTFAEQYLSDDVRWNILGSDPVTGKSDVMEVVKMSQLQSFPDITITNVIADGVYVVIESTGKATTKSGRPYNQQYCDVYRFNGDKLQEINTYLDTALSESVSS